MKPIIGITGNSMYLNDSFYPEPLHVNHSPRALTKAVAKAGGTPVIIPVEAPAMMQQYAEFIDGLILAGGQDISPRLYGEEPRTTIKATSPERDASEVALTKAVLLTGKPILGICRGLQLLNAMFGGSLYQDLSENENISIKHIQETSTSYPTHQVKVDSASYMGAFLPSELNVNSLHHQVIRELGEGLRATAVASDGVIEAVESVDAGKNVLAVQWHPESMHQDRNHLAFFKDLVTRAKSVEPELSQLSDRSETPGKVKTVFN